MSWNPFHEAHSIEAVSAAVNFYEPLNDVVWRRVIREAESRANACGLSARSQVRTGMQFSIGAAPGVPPVPQLDVDAVRFYRNASDEESNTLVPTETLTVAKGVLLYHTTAYTRWEAMLPQLRTILTEPLGIALEAVYVNNLRLEYRDVFKQVIDQSPPLVTNLLRSGCDLLAPHIFRRNQLFHSHTGFFEPCDSCDQRLIQLNVDANDLIENNEQVRAITIMTAVQDNFFPQLEAERNRTSSELVARFDSLHKRCDEVFKSVITDEIAERVGMNS